MFSRKNSNLHEKYAFFDGVFPLKNNAESVFKEPGFSHRFYPSHAGSAR